MFKRYAIGTLAAAAALATLAGCGQQSANQSGSSAADLHAAATRGLDLDYTHLANPAAAVAASELIVRGTVVEVVDGITFGGPAAAQAGRSTPYVTFVIKVDAALKGSVPAGAKVYTQVEKSTASSTADLAKAGRNLKVVAVLDDISGWSPAPGVTVVRPAGTPAKGALYHTFPDGLWLQGGADRAMVGVHAERAEIPAAWGQPQTLDQYWTTLEKAAK